MIKNKKSLFKKILIACGSLVIALCCLFVNVRADSQSDYQTGYDDGYRQGIEDSFSNFNTYSVISNYYQNAICFISQDYGATFQSASQYIQATRSGDKLNITSSNGYSTNANVQYYVSINLSSPCNIKDVRFLAASNSRPDPLKVVIDSSEFGFTYTNIDDVGYMWSNQIMLKASTIEIYFKGTANVPSTFSLWINGYDTSLESYQNGYNQGVSDTESRLNITINSLQDQVTTLSNQVTTLTNQLNNVNGSWQSLFFAMADTPFYTISNLLGFDLFGINLFNALVGLLTVLACFFLYKKLFH